MKPMRFPLPFLFTATGLAAASLAQAATVNWMTAGAGDWFDGSNWGGVAPGPSDTVAITNGGTAFISSADVAVAGLTLGDVAGGVGTLVLQNDRSLSVSSGALEIAKSAGSTGTLDIGAHDLSSTGGTLTVPAIVFGGGTGTLNFNQTDTVTLGAVMSGAGSLVQRGSGTTVLSGTSTRTGITTISAGVLSVAMIGNGGVAGNLGASAAAAGNHVFDGGTLRYTGATASTNRVFTINPGKTAAFEIAANNLTLAAAIPASTGALTKLGGGTLTMAAANLYAGKTTVSAGTLAYGVTNALGSGAVTIDGATAVLDLGGFTDSVGFVTLANGGTLKGTSSATLLTSGAQAGFDLQSGTVATRIGGSVAVKKSTGGTVIFSNTVAHAFTGVLTIEAGTLQVGDGNANGTLSASGQGVDNKGLLVFNQSGAYTYNQQISGSGAVTKLGASTLTLATTNIYSGLTTVTAGTLAYGASNALGSGPVKVEGGKLDLGNNQSDTVGIVTLVLGSITGTGTSTLTSTGSFQMESGTASAKLGGGVPLSKTTSGLVTLSGANTYTGGTSITGGTLVAGSNTALGTGIVSIAGGTLDLGGRSLANAATLSAGTLLGGGSLGATTTAGGAISPGGTAAGTMTFSSLALGAGTILNLDVGSSGWDTIFITQSGGLTLGGTLNISLLGGYTAGSYHVLNWSGQANGMFSAVVLPPLAAGLQWDDSALSSAGVLGIVAVPEPEHGGLAIAVALLALLVARRRRAEV